MSDLGDNVVRDVLKRLMQRRTMNNVETNYLEGLFQRAIEHNKKQHGLFSLLRPWPSSLRSVFLELAVTPLKYYYI